MSHFSKKGWILYKKMGGGEWIYFFSLGGDNGVKGGRHHPLNFDFWRPYVDGEGV